MCGKRVEPKEKIRQRSVGFRNRQHEFFSKYTEFNPDKFCRDIVDEQIEKIDRSFL